MPSTTENDQVAVDNLAVARLREGLLRLELSLPESVTEQLWRFAALLLKWNRTTNLTTITEPFEVVEKHLLDALLAHDSVAEVKTLLDFGAGGGVPGIPLALANASLSVCMVDAVSKKVNFLKYACAQLGIAPRVSARHVRLSGEPQAEHLVPADAVISRAFTDFERFVSLALPYLKPEGRVIAMVGKPLDRALVEQVAAAHRCQIQSATVYALPFSGHARSVVVLRR
jgi:16S rRNA (guanine527-N7)-methyltransferase